MALPKSFTDLEKAYNSMPNTVLNIIGVIVDVMAATLTAKGQYMQTFKILDPKLRDSVFGNEGLRLRFFKEDLQRLPQIKDLGDVILLRNIKISFFQGQSMALSNYQTEVTVIPAAEIPAPAFEAAFQGKHRLRCLGSRMDVSKMTLEEQSYIIQLKHDMIETVQSMARDNRVSSNAKTSDILSETPTARATMRSSFESNLNAPDSKRLKFSNKFRLISELRHRDFADIIAQVVKKFSTHAGLCELYVTDYTENKEMFYYTPPEQEDESERDGDTFGYTGASKRSWPGPYEWLVLKVDTKDPHAHYANTEVREGDFVLLKNVKIKVYNHLEGNMWPDDRNPGEVKIVKLKNFQMPEISAVLERKEQYWAVRNTKSSNEGQPKQKKPTKSEMKKQKKQRKAERAAAAATEDGKSKAVESISGLQNGANKDAPKVDLNPHVRCTHPDVPISSVKSILDPTNEKHTNTTREGTTYVLPFVNVKYRARMRVVDYEPKALEEFALPKLSDDGHESEDTPMVDYESSPEYEWSFSLLLEDASKPNNAIGASENQTWVNVHHEHAQYLFGNDMEDPKDLYNDHRLLSKLKEKLCILWGNLEEKRDGQQLSNRPFDCCLAEYGIEMDDDDPQKASHPFGWIRMYSMEGVTIL